MTAARRLAATGLAALLSLAAQPAAAEKIRLGYWTSGFSLGIGAVLEAEKFLEKEGLEVEYVRFSEVNGPTKAILTKSIDLAVAVPTAGSMQAAADGAPVKIVLATQIAEGQIVTLASSGVTGIADLKGKKIGMSPAGSATYALTTAFLEANHDLKLSDYQVVHANEARLAQFLAQGEIAAGALRAVTVAQINETPVRVLANNVDEWKRLSGSNSVPILATAIVHDDFAAGSPEAIVKFILGLKKASDYGARNTARVAQILKDSANLAADDATAYAGLWEQIYIASLSAGDLATLKRQEAIYKAGGTLTKDVPPGAYDTRFYEQARARLP